MKRLIALLCCSLCFISCQNKQEIKDAEPIKKEEKKTFKMYQASEMAALMEQMYVENARVKAEIEAGDFTPGQIPDFFTKIHTATFTDPTDLDEFFKNEAERFLKAQALVYASPVDRKANFNQAIDACISCHTVKCNGPIERIKKLYIK